MIKAASCPKSGAAMAVPAVPSPTALDHIQVVKAKVQAEEDITPELKYFIYAGNLITDRHTLSEYGVHDGCTVLMACDHMLINVSVHESGETVPLVVSPCELVEDVKYHIQLRKGFPQEQ